MLCDLLILSSRNGSVLVRILLSRNDKRLLENYSLAVDKNLEERDVYKALFYIKKIVQLYYHVTGYDFVACIPLKVLLQFISHEAFHNKKVCSLKCPKGFQIP